MALILQSIMKPHSSFRTRESSTESSFAKSSLTKSSVETFQSKSNRVINYSNAARIQALTLAEGLQTLASMEKDIAVKIAAAQSHIGEKTVLKYMKTAKI